MDQRRFDRLTAEWGSGTGRRSMIAGLLAGTAAVFGQGGAATARKRNQKARKKRCRHCPQRACCACSADGLQTASKCILLETPNAEITLTVATALCDAFCTGPNEQVLTVNDNIAGFANVCNANNSCGVEKCPVLLKA